MAPFFLQGTHFSLYFLSRDRVLCASAKGQKIELERLAADQNGVPVPPVQGQWLSDICNCS